MVGVRACLSTLFLLGESLTHLLRVARQHSWQLQTCPHPHLTPTICIPGQKNVNTQNIKEFSATEGTLASGGLSLTVTEQKVSRVSSHKGEGNTDSRLAGSLPCMESGLTSPEGTWSLVCTAWCYSMLGLAS